MIAWAMDVLKLSESAAKLADVQGSSVGNAAKAFWHDQPQLDSLTKVETPHQAITAKNLGLQPAADDVPRVQHGRLREHGRPRRLRPLV